jgi:hypothetical protein
LQVFHGGGVRNQISTIIQQEFVQK